MFAKLVKKRESKYNEPMRKILIALDDEKIGSEKHTQLTDQLERYEKLKALEPKKSFDWAPVITGSAHVVGLVILVGYEHKNVVGGKAVNLVKSILR